MQYVVSVGALTKAFRKEKILIRFGPANKDVQKFAFNKKVIDQHFHILMSYGIVKLSKGSSLYVNKGRE